MLADLVVIVRGGVVVGVASPEDSGLRFTVVDFDNDPANEPEYLTASGDGVSLAFPWLLEQI